MKNIKKLYPNQIVPLFLTTVVFGFGVVLLYLTTIVLNRYLSTSETISLQVRPFDILIGATIYLKTAIDFAIFIGRLMDKYPGWKNRVAIETGTALGNIVGTLGILLVWDIFREVRILMAVMIVIASLVLLRMAEDGFEHTKDEAGNYKLKFGSFLNILEKSLERINKIFSPLLNKIIPHTDIKIEGKNKSFKAVILLSFTVPFILGLDDFAGYIPLFSIVNVFGFAIGVFLGHMVLNIALFIKPKLTVRAVKHPFISFVGSVAFIALAVWGFVEAGKLLGLIAH